MEEDLEMGLYRVFKAIKEKQLSIIFDTSGSMYQFLEVGKASIVKLVNYLSHSCNDSQFNVISFSKSNTSFSDSVVPCSKRNLFLLAEWLKKLKCDTQTNSLLALVSAFSDENCDGVVLFTDGLPSQKSTVVLKCVEEISDGRPLHVIYVNDNSDGGGMSNNNSRNVISFWEHLTERTYGTFHVVKHTKRQDEKFDVLSAGQLADHRHLPQSGSSSDGSTDIGYNKNKNKLNTKNSDAHKLFSRSKMSNYGLSNKRIGKEVLAKCNDDGIFYKGKIIEESQSDVTVYFKPETKGFSGVTGRFDLEDVIFFNDDDSEKIYEGDSVLVNCQGDQYIPGTVLKKEYIYDEEDDNLDFIKMLRVNTYNQHIQIVPARTAVRVSEERSKRMVREIIRKQIDTVDENIDRLEESKMQLFRSKSYDRSAVYGNNSMMVPSGITFIDDAFDGVDGDDADSSERDFLKEKIERQLAESSAFMRNLSIGKDTNDHHYNDYEDDESEDFRRSMLPPKSKSASKMRKDRLAQSLNFPATRRLKSARSFVPEQDSMARSCNNFKAPKPPRTPSQKKIRTWGGPVINEDDNESQQQDRTKRIRSKTVGSNVVERSKKHWAGRPITRESAPKRSMNESLDRYRVIKSKKNPPVADDYQTADGVPFPAKTDNKFHQRPPTTYSLNNEVSRRETPPYMHRDIIGHRVVDMSDQNGNTSQQKQFNERIGSNDRKAELREAKRARAMKDSTERRLKKFEERKQQAKDEKQQRDEQVRDKKKSQEDEGYTKIQITIEKDRSNLEKRQRKLEYWRNFETGREARNQQRKHDRIDAMKERKTDYPQLKEENARQVHVNPEQEKREKKQQHFEQNRLEKEIEKHESKLERLRKARKSTDARFDSLRKKNDYYRDMNNHVKDLSSGRKRAEILP